MVYMDCLDITARVHRSDTVEEGKKLDKIIGGKAGKLHWTCLYGERLLSIRVG